MQCSEIGRRKTGDGGDRLEGGRIERHFDDSSTAWLIGEAVKQLNLAGPEAELAYARSVELLRQSEDLVKTVAGILRRVHSGDGPLRWCILHVLGDAGGADSADLLVHAALEELPEPQHGQGCEGTRDVEMLVRTMAVVALQRVAGRHREALGHVMQVVSARPDRAVLIEAVKAARDLGLADKVRETLPKESLWILDIRRAKTQELVADPEREGGNERGFTPPKFGKFYTAPQSGCGCSRRKD